MDVTARIVKTLAQSTTLWQWGLNFDRTVKHRLGRQAPKVDPSILRDEGILSAPAESLLDSEGVELLRQIEADLQMRAQSPDVQAMIQQGDSGRGAKNFSISLLKERQFDVASPLIRLGVHPNLLSTVNAYMGMRSYLRDIVVWLNFPTQGPSRETQLWHRDGDDHLNVKVFIYLNDVTDLNGPFCFIPETHPTGRLKIKKKWGRVTDDEMVRLVPRERWKVYTGRKNTVIIADTCGFHRGLKPESGYRMLLMFHYTSGKPWYPSTLVIRNPQGVPLSRDQHDALYI